jgi:hypothetical protein
LIEEKSILNNIQRLLFSIVTSENSPIKDYHALMHKHTIPDVIKAKQYIDEMDAMKEAYRADAEDREKAKHA